MLYLHITSVGKFTSLLFSEDSFDRFLLHDVSVEALYTTVIEGRKNASFFSEEERESALSPAFVEWRDIRPSVYKLLSGKRLPVSFRVVLLTSPESTKSIVAKSGFDGCAVTSLSITVQYREQKLTVSTGISYGGFSLDKTLEKYWDSAVISFLEGKSVEFEIPED